MSFQRMQFFCVELGGSSGFPNINSSVTQGQLMYHCSPAMFERLKTPIKIGPADNGISFVMSKLAKVSLESVDQMLLLSNHLLVLDLDE